MPTSPSHPTDDVIQEAGVIDEEKAKGAVVHTEDVLSDDVIMKSPFEEMDFRKTTMVFRNATFLALLAAFSAAAE
jgi:MFS transporter, SP family, general alpha glucoside:H+ symporter